MTWLRTALATSVTVAAFTLTSTAALACVLVQDDRDPAAAHTYRVKPKRVEAVILPPQRPAISARAPIVDKADDGALTTDSAAVVLPPLLLLALLLLPLGITHSRRVPTESSPRG